MFKSTIKFSFLILLINLLIGCSGSVNQGSNGHILAFDSMGGNFIEPVEVENGSVVVLPIPIKEGHEFLGWFTGEGPNDIQLNDFTAIYRDIDVFAKWEKIIYQISFWNDEILIYEGLLEFDDVIEYPTSPQKGLNVFMGWSEDSKDELINYNTMPSRNLKLKPIWEGYYQIEFDVNEGTHINSILLGFEYPIIDLPIPTKLAATFMGWYMDEELSKPFDLEKMPRENLVLFAKWEEHTRINLNSVGGEPLNPIVLESGEMIRSLPIPFRLGHAFRGWFLEVTYDTEFTDKLMPEFNTTLYAKWESLENFNAQKLIINYHRFDERYAPWSVWLWPSQPQGKDGKNIPFNEFNPKTGSRQLILDLEDSHFEDSQRIGLIIRQGDWTKDVPIDLFININQADEKGVIEVFVISGDPTVYYNYDDIKDLFD